MSGEKSHERRQRLHCAMIGYCAVHMINPTCPFHACSAFADQSDIMMLKVQYVRFWHQNDILC